MSIYKKITSLLATLLTTGVLVLAPVALAQDTQVTNIFDDACLSSPKTAASAVCKNETKNRNTNPWTGPDGVLLKAARIISIAVGVASIIMIMIGGFKYVTSNGEASSIESAKNIILFSIIGVVIALLSQTLISFVFSRIE